MVKQFAGVLAFVLFAASMVLLLPRLVYANTGTPPTLTITTESPAANPNPVPVGVSGTGPFTTVTFQVDVTDGNEQNESGPVSVKSQQYTISGGGGMIVGVGAPQGYTATPATIPSTGLASVTVTGSSSNSFELSATLFFPQTAAGEDTVTCSGVLNLTDGTQVDSSPGGSVQVAAVAVDSVALADDPSTVQIGQTLTRSDFTITTTPSGYGNYRTGGPEMPGPYLVTLSPASFAVAVGDNIVTARCGVSKAEDDVLGAEMFASLTGAHYDVGLDLVLADFAVEVLGTDGSYGFTGPDAAGGDTSGALVNGVPFSGVARLNLTSGSKTEDFLNVVPGATAAGAITENGPLAQAASVGEAEVGPIEIAKLAVKLVMILDWDTDNAKVSAKAQPTTLSLTTAALGNYNAPQLPGAVSCGATWSASGVSHWGLIGGYYYTDSPKFTVACTAPSYKGNVLDTITQLNFQFGTESTVGVPTIPLGQFPLSQGTKFCQGNANGLVVVAQGATQAVGSYNGHCGIINDDGKAEILTIPNDPGWGAGPAPMPSAVSMSADWFY